jgi:peroxiredoxin
MPMRNSLLAGILVLMVQLAGCSDAAPESATAGEIAAVPTRAEDVQPVTVGAPAPTAVLRTPDGEAFDLAAAYGRAPTLLIFYRGGWCPYCSAHLGEIAMLEDELAGMGVQVLAVSPDRPAKLLESVEDRELGYTLLSDADMSLTRTFGLAFELGEEEVARYARGGFDLVDASGHDHHLLPVPAVYLIDRDGLIRFAHWDPDYRQRIDIEDLLAAVRESAGHPGES